MVVTTLGKLRPGNICPGSLHIHVHTIRKQEIPQSEWPEAIKERHTYLTTIPP